MVVIWSIRHTLPQPTALSLFLGMYNQCPLHFPPTSFPQVTTEEQRVKFTEQLTDAEDWLYGDGEHEGAAAYKAKLKGLKAVGEPMKYRAQEMELRPEMIRAVREQVELSLKVANVWPSSKPWINETEVKSVVDKVGLWQHMFWFVCL